MLRSRSSLALTITSALAVVIWPGGEALACPDCETARVVRASVFGEGFWANLLLVSSPLVVLGAITALLHRVGIERPARTGPRSTEAP